MFASGNRDRWSVRAPLAQLALQMLRHVVPLVNGRMAVVSCGGIETGFDIFERLKAGADMVQIYSALIYHGPAW